MSWPEAFVVLVYWASLVLIAWSWVKPHTPTPATTTCTRKPPHECGVSGPCNGYPGSWTGPVVDERLDNKATLHPSNRSFDDVLRDILAETRQPAPAKGCPVAGCRIRAQHSHVNALLKRIRGDNP